MNKIDMSQYLAPGHFINSDAPSVIAYAKQHSAGAKDQRFALPNARIMVHQPSGGFQGQATDIMLHAQEILAMKKRLNEIYVKHTGQSLKKIEDALERDYFLTAEAARDFGLVDKVIDKRLEELAPKQGLV